MGELVLINNDSGDDDFYHSITMTNNSHYSRLPKTWSCRPTETQNTAQKFLCNRPQLAQYRSRRSRNFRLREVINVRPRHWPKKHQGAGCHASSRRCCTDRRRCESEGKPPSGHSAPSLSTLPPLLLHPASRRWRSRPGSGPRLEEEEGLEGWKTAFCSIASELWDPEAPNQRGPVLQCGNNNTHLTKNWYFAPPILFKYFKNPISFLWEIAFCSIASELWDPEAQTNLDLFYYVVLTTHTSLKINILHLQF